MIITKIFPYITQIHVLQLEEYDSKRFLRWVLKNPLKRSLENKVKLVYTKKVKTLLFLSLVLSFLTLYLLVSNLGLIGFPLWFVLNLVPAFFLIPSVLMYKPYEIINRIVIKIVLEKRIEYLKSRGLVVIGITGSYGKTSVKENLYNILRKEYKTLKTPGSYNTLFGIKKVVDYELDESYKYFIVEMGAYKRGEIKELCDVYQPDFGILIGINEQHLERFGSIENTISAKFELPAYIGIGTKVLLNRSDKNIIENYKNFITDPVFYENAESAFLSNVNVASKMAVLLGMREDLVEKFSSELKPTKHRLEVKEFPNGVTLIDDAYSSNVTGFKEALRFLNSFDGRGKIIVTPGIVELGNKTKEIHIELGKLIAGVCDFVILVGRSLRTESLEEGIADKSKIAYINSVSSFMKVVEKTDLKNPVVLLENDLPDNY